MTRDVNEEGASSVEYGLIVFAIAALIALIVFAFGGVTESMYRGSCDEFASAATSSNSC